MVGALYLTARYRPATGHVDHVSNDRAGCAVQSVAWDRHRRELFPCVRLGVVGLVGTKYLSGCFTAKNNNLATDVDA